MCGNQLSGATSGSCHGYEITTVCILGDFICRNYLCITNTCSYLNDSGVENRVVNVECVPC